MQTTVSKHEHSEPGRLGQSRKQGNGLFSGRYYQPGKSITELESGTGFYKGIGVPWNSASLRTRVEISCLKQNFAPPDLITNWPCAQDYGELVNGEFSNGRLHSINSLGDFTVCSVFWRNEFVSV